MERLWLLNAESTVINKGPPERRLLNTTKQEIGEHGNIRWTFGIRNPQKMMRTIILLGEMGTEKSTLINVMTNYILGVEWSDKICYEIVKDYGEDQTESQTSKVNVYEIFGYEDGRVPFSLRIIDTPGYGDTKGKKIDQHVVEDLCHLFQCEDGVHQLDAVCLVVKASQNREKSKKHMEAFFEYLNTLETRSLLMICEVLFECEKLKCCMKSLQDQIVQAEHKQNEIRQTQAALEKNKEGVEENKNFEYVVEESLVDKIESDSYAILCEKCKFTCYHSCTSWLNFCSLCAITYIKNCTSCPKKCSLSFHVREKMRYVPSVRMVTKTSEQLKEKHEESSREVESEQKMQEKLQEELSEIEREKQRLILESYNHIIRLNEIALRPESLSILPNLSFLIAKLHETNQSDKAQKLEDIHKRAMEAHNTEEGEQSSLMKFIASLYS